MMNIYNCRYHTRKSKKPTTGGLIYVPLECAIFKDGDKLTGVIKNGALVLTRTEDLVK